MPRFVELTRQLDAGFLAQLNVDDEADCPGRKNLIPEFLGRHIELGLIAVSAQQAAHGAENSEVIIDDCNNRTFWHGHFITATSHSRLAMICQSVVATGQAPKRPEHAADDMVHNIDAKGLADLPTATGVVARLAYARAREAGVALEPLLRRAGLNDQEISDCSVRIHVRRQIRFLNLAAEALRDDLLGFHLALSPDLREAGLLYYVAASSDTLGDALERVSRFSAIVNEGLSVKYFAGHDCRVALRYVGVSRHVDRHQIEFSMTLLLRICRQLTGQRLAPTSARLMHWRGSDASELAAYFGGNVEFSATADELTFAGEADEMRVVSADPYLNKLLVANCEEALSRRPAPYGSFRARVENSIVPLLPHGHAHASEIAKRLGLSQRTAARRLAAEGLSFSGVLESLRSDLAQQYLSDPALSISHVAWLLGYHEVSAFTHAFKRWTGKTPRETRQPSPPVAIDA